jgi:outer membrane receptor protein involved in Fe transport
VHTKFEDFDSSSLGDLSGSRFPEASKWNVAVGADYHHPSGFFVGADAKYTSDFLARFGTAPQETLDGYFVANLQAGYRYRNLTATVFAENVFDEDYFLYNDNDVAATLGPRRVVGLTLKAEL